MHRLEKQGSCPQYIIAHGLVLDIAPPDARRNTGLIDARPGRQTPQQRQLREGASPFVLKGTSSEPRIMSRITLVSGPWLTLWEGPGGRQRKLTSRLWPKRNVCSGPRPPILVVMQVGSYRWHGHPSGTSSDDVRIQHSKMWFEPAHYPSNPQGTAAASRHKPPFALVGALAAARLLLARSLAIKKPAAVAAVLSRKDIDRLS